MSLRTIDRSQLPARPAAAVRVLHTSDWHLGVAVRNEPRDRDHDAVLSELVEVAAAAGPDLVVHTGDLFNGGRPGMADFGRAIRVLRELADVAPVVVMAGNHDSAVALETLGVAVSDPVPELVAAGTYDPDATCPARIRVLHRPTSAPGGAVATFPTRAGGRLRLVALPFVHANRVAGEWEDVLTSHSTYTDGIRKICDLLTSAAFADFDAASDVAVFASHLHVSGARTSTEKEIHVSSEYATDPAHLSPDYGYLAFGHIHIAQAVAASRGRYAGSILEVDFGEEGEAKQVVVADLTPGRPTAIHDVALRAGRRIHRVTAPYSRLSEHATAIGDGLVEVTIGPEEGGGEGAITLEIPGFDSLAAAVHDALPDATIVGVLDGRRPETAVADDLHIPETTETPAELFRGWLAESGSPLLARYSTGHADPERIARMFEEIHTAVTTDSEVELDGLARLLTLVEGAD
ncbi:metallophosphoesterase [Iamia majanohamensis]|uniref:Nuclease SbcCD subunit D n=1 Tax=Iamia majanohamensis TaxID=467976 RepID=A0AAE9Y9X4_9ACTN|nr:metallophosphoesterase [Iamia majanohamensis]WCO67248.1 metallophosphoesterase [Iamia majanohamensis]